MAADDERQSPEQNAQRKKRHRQPGRGGSGLRYEQRPAGRYATRQCRRQTGDDSHGQTPRSGEARSRVHCEQPARAVGSGRRYCARHPPRFCTCERTGLFSRYVVARCIDACGRRISCRRQLSARRPETTAHQSKKPTPCRTSSPIIWLARSRPISCSTHATRWNGIRGARVRSPGRALKTGPSSSASATQPATGVM